MNIVIGIIVGLLVLMFLIVAHEFGHFIAARRNGVKVKEFGICFPPRAIAWQKGKDGKWHRLPKSKWKKPDNDSLIISLNWIPIGGFCAMDGESNADTRKGTFGAATFWQKTKILFAGVAMNWIVAFLILTVLAITGLPQFINNQFSVEADAHTDTKPVAVASVQENSPAAKAGFQAGDLIESINGQTVTTGGEIIDYNNQHPGEKLNYSVIREDQNITLSPTLNQAGSPYLLGVSMATSQTLTRYTWSAPIVGAATTVQLTGETFRGLGMLVWNLGSGIASQLNPDAEVREQGRATIGAAGDSVSGPVGIIGTIFPAFTAAGPTNLAFLAALISVALACMNVLPIPALDGGRWLLIAIFKLRKKKLTKEKEEKIVGRAFLVLIALIILITIVDITKFF